MKPNSCAAWYHFTLPIIGAGGGWRRLAVQLKSLLLLWRHRRPTTPLATAAQCAAATWAASFITPNNLSQCPSLLQKAPTTHAMPAVGKHVRPDWAAHPPDSIMEAPQCRFRREARPRRAISTSIDGGKSEALDNYPPQQGRVAVQSNWMRRAKWRPRARQSGACRPGTHLARSSSTCCWTPPSEILARSAASRSGRTSRSRCGHDLAHGSAIVSPLQPHHHRRLCRLAPDLLHDHDFPVADLLLFRLREREVLADIEARLFAIALGFTARTAASSTTATIKQAQCIARPKLAIAKMMA